MSHKFRLTILIAIILSAVFSALPVFKENASAQQSQAHYVGGTCFNSLPNDCPCPSPNCSGNVGTNRGGSSNKMKIKEELGQDDRYKTMQVTGAMGRANNQYPVDPGAWFNQYTSSYIDAKGNYYGSSSGGGLPNLPLDPGTQGSMPNGAMPMKNTPALSFVQFFPWLYKDIDPSAQNYVYRGIGTNGGTDVSSPVPTSASVTGMGDEELQASTSQNASGLLACADGSVCGAVTAGMCADGTSCINPTAIATNSIDLTKCKAITNTCNNGVPDPDSLEVWSRLQYDSCSNQYILSGALTPGVIFNETYREHQNPWNESMCQPLNLKKVPVSPLCSGSSISGNYGTLYDYDAACYLDQAWYNILSNSYMLGGGVSQGDQGSAPWANGVIGTCGSYVKGCSNGLATILGDVSSISSYMNLNTLLGLLLSGSNTNSGQSIGAPGSTSTNSNGIPVIRSNVTNQDLAQYPYERIFDPTHPYSPRWDWQHTDRDFSQRALFFNDPCKSDKGSNGGDDVSQEDPGCNYPSIPFVGYDPIGPSHADCVVRCAAVPVDILSFRANEFSACMGCRIEINTLCFWMEVLLLQVPVEIGIYYDFEGLSSQDAFNVVVSSEDGWLKIFQLFDYDLYWGYMDPIGYCKDFFDTLGDWPICSTKYDYPDDSVAFLCSACTSASGDSNSSGGVKKCCNDLAHPLVPINILKIRNLQDDPELAPVPEGYAFKEYFTGPSQDNGTGLSCPPLSGGSSSGGSGNSGSSGGPKGASQCPHMPFMRWWDTGAAAGGTGDSDYNATYDPNCDKGKDDVIVGVGIEGESCKYGGGGSSGGSQARSYANNCIQIPKPDAMTSWSELKHYEMNTIHDFGLYCIGQYEKLYKVGGAEEGPLAAAGGYFNSKHYKAPCDDGSACGSGSSGGGVSLCMDKSQCTPCGVSGSSGGNSGSSSGGVAGSSCPWEPKVNPWPLSWRGYLSELNAPCRFPSFKGIPLNYASSSGGSGSSGGVVCGGSGGGQYNGPGAVTGGLDNAQVGDIIYLTHADSFKIGSQSSCSDGSACNGGTCAGNSNESCNDNYIMPFMAIVTGVSHGAKKATWAWPYLLQSPYPSPISQCDDGSICSVDSTPGTCKDGSTCAPRASCSDGSICGANGTANQCGDGSACTGYQYPAVADMNTNCPQGAPCVSTCSDYIEVVDENNGKYPDVCGNTDYRGMGQPRIIYKEFLPTTIYESIYPQGTVITSSCNDSYTVSQGVSTPLTVQNDGNCIDPKMTTCTFFSDTASSGTQSLPKNPWDQFEIYRPSLDPRTNATSR